MERISAEALERIRARERRQATLRALPAIDWQQIADSDEWFTVSRAPTSADYADRMREFERIRKQARDWARRHGYTPKVRRLDRATLVLAYMEKIQ